MMTTAFAEVDRAALRVGEPPVVEHLQQELEDVGVRLLDLVEQQERVRVAAHGLGELARPRRSRRSRAGRRAAGRRCALSNSLMSRRTSSRCRTAPRRAPGASSVLPTPVGPRKRKEPTGRPGRPSPPGRAHRLGDGVDGLVLADDPLVQVVLQAEQPSFSAGLGWRPGCRCAGTPPRPRRPRVTCACRVTAGWPFQLPTIRPAAGEPPLVVLGGDRLVLARVSCSIRSRECPPRPAARSRRARAPAWSIRSMALSGSNRSVR